MANELPDALFDLIIADPPYNIGIKNSQWDRIDDYVPWCEKWIKESARLLKDGGQLFIYGSTMYNYISHLNIIAEKYLTFGQHISWVYTNGTGGRSNTTVYPSRSEHLVRFYKGDTYTFNVEAIREQYTEEEKRIAKLKKALVKDETLNKGKIPFDWWLIHRCNSRSKEREFGSHPSQKPLEICDRIILAHSNEGDNILIPFSGSGSECVSAKKLKRNFLAADTELEYVDLGNRRVGNVV